MEHCQWCGHVREMSFHSNPTAILYEAMKSGWHISKDGWTCKTCVGLRNSVLVRAQEWAEHIEPIRDPEESGIEYRLKDAIQDLERVRAALNPVA